MIGIGWRTMAAVLGLWLRALGSGICDGADEPTQSYFEAYNAKKAENPTV